MTKRGIEHIEIPAKGRANLAKFYADIFGWEIQPMDEMHYTLWDAGNLGGGFAEVDEMYQPGDVLVHIQSDDIEADLKKIEKLGGKTLRGKSEIPGTGWWAVFTDPTGNRMALFTGLPHE
jgi:hypothetical protein